MELISKRSFHSSRHFFKSSPFQNWAECGGLCVDAACDRWKCSSKLEISFRTWQWRAVKADWNATKTLGIASRVFPLFTTFLWKVVKSVFIVHLSSSDPRGAVHLGAEEPWGEPTVYGRTTNSASASFVPVKGPHFFLSKKVSLFHRRRVLFNRPTISIFWTRHKTPGQARLLTSLLNLNVPACDAFWIVIGLHECQSRSLYFVHIFLFSLTINCWDFI